MMSLTFGHVYSSERFRAFRPSCYMMGKVLSGELTCPCGRSCCGFVQTDETQHSVESYFNDYFILPATSRLQHTATYFWWQLGHKLLLSFLV